MYSLSSLRAEGEAIQFGCFIQALIWIATKLTLLAMTIVEKTLFPSYLGITAAVISYKNY